MLSQPNSTFCREFPKNLFEVEGAPEHVLDDKGAAVDLCEDSLLAERRPARRRISRHWVGYQGGSRRTFR